MTAPVTIIEAMEDPAIFGAAFRDGASWGAWRAFLKGVLRRFQARLLRPVVLGRLPLELRFQTLHLVFEAQLELLEPHFL